MIIFRGSVVLKDWLMDVNFSKTSPDQIKEFAENVEVHQGFSGESALLFNFDSKMKIFSFSHYF